MDELASRPGTGESGAESLNGAESFNGAESLNGADVTAGPEFTIGAHERDCVERLAPVLVPRQANRGGSIILVQVENEYGAYGADKAYLRRLV
jgi:hypothetical protein